MKPWYQQKTTWFGIGGVLTAVGQLVCSVAGGQGVDATAVANLLLALQVIFLRQAVK